MARLTVAASLVVGAVLGVTGAAAAWTLTGQLQQWATGRCLDSNSAGNVYTAPCQAAGNGSQVWVASGSYGYTPEGYAHVNIQNAATGRCLTLYRDGNTPVLQTAQCGVISKIKSQLLDARGPNWSNVQLRNSSYGNICVDANAAGTAYALDCNYGTYQTFRMLG